MGRGISRRPYFSALANNDFSGLNTNMQTIKTHVILIHYGKLVLHAFLRFFSTCICQVLLLFSLSVQKASQIMDALHFHKRSACFHLSVQGASKFGCPSFPQTFCTAVTRRVLFPRAARRRHGTWVPRNETRHTKLTSYARTAESASQAAEPDV